MQDGQKGASGPGKIFSLPGKFSPIPAYNKSISHGNFPLDEPSQNKYNKKQVIDLCNLPIRREGACMIYPIGIVSPGSESDGGIYPGAAEHPELYDQYPIPWDALVRCVPRPF